MQDDSTHIIVALSENVFVSLGLDLLEESRWLKSEYSGYVYRIDPARPEMRQRRHVAIAQEKHTSTKTKQVAWNDDGTRHDKKTFDTHFKSMPTAKAIARMTLMLPPDAILESMPSRETTDLLVEALLHESDQDFADSVCLVLRDFM